MKIMQLYANKQSNPNNEKAPVIAFLGDSVTNGCFELIVTENDGFEPVYDEKAVYHNQLKEIFSMLYPSVPAVFINAGISGNHAGQGLDRLERDVLRFHPDLTVVCFGLNDSHKGMEMIDWYINNLRTIFEKLKENGSEIIYLTPNMMVTTPVPDLGSPSLNRAAKRAMEVENNHILENYVNEGRKIAREMGIPICDIYKMWKKLEQENVEISHLLSNAINHPIKDMHKLVAVELLHTILEN